MAAPARLLAAGRGCPPELLGAGPGGALAGLEILRPLAASAQCFVAAVRTRAGGRLGVVKSYRKSALDDGALAQVELEVKIHEQLDRALPGGVVGFWAALEDGSQLHILTAHAACDLRAALAARRGGGMPEAAVAARVVAPLLAVLAAMHARRWLHRDVKPENVLLPDKDGPAVLGDFGLAIALPAAARDRAERAQPAPGQQTATAPAAGGQRPPRSGGGSCGGGGAGAGGQRPPMLRSSASSDRICLLGGSAGGGGGDDDDAPLPPRGPRVRRSSSSGCLPYDCRKLPQLTADQLHAGGTPAYSAPEVVLSAFHNTPVAAALGPQARRSAPRRAAPQAALRAARAAAPRARARARAHTTTRPRRAQNDVWSLGVLAWECLTGQHPFGDPSMSPGAYMCRIVSPAPLPFDGLARAGVSAAARDWLAAALCRDPAQRATAAQLARHAWLDGAAAAGEEDEQAAAAAQQPRGGGCPEQLQHRQRSCPEPRLQGCTSDDLPGSGPSGSGAAGLHSLSGGSPFGAPAAAAAAGDGGGDAGGGGGDAPGSREGSASHCGGALRASLQQRSGGTLTFPLNSWED
ncbi:IPL1 [Scenedesmus sp. PABB004]|nr:IPL1 [Scenedesmus sp. PABB004]